MAMAIVLTLEWIRKGQRAYRNSSGLSRFSACTPIGSLRPRFDLPGGFRGLTFRRWVPAFCGLAAGSPCGANGSNCRTVILWIWILRSIPRV